jgi:hypothetical protein
LTVVTHPQHGHFGGYLLINSQGRPLEFHCTAPVKPNRAQEILYGASLESHLFGEQIGQTLLAHSKLGPAFVCVDQPALLCVRSVQELPVAFVGAKPTQPLDEVDENRGQRRLRFDAGHPRASATAQFSLGSNRLATAAGYERDQANIEQALAALAEHVDLLEPFERIREAINEAQRSGR